MGTLVVNRRKSKSPQIGDLRDRIALYERDIQPPDFNSAKVTEEHTLIDTVWAKHDTFDGKKIFTGVGIEKIITDSFTIRYRSDITSEEIVKFDDINYEIVKIDDPNGRKRFLTLMCIVLGDTNLEANQ